MKLNELIAQLQLEARTGAQRGEMDIIHGYASDLLSDVMAHAQEGDIWITLQTHQNIVAVAVMKSLAGVILVKNREPDEATIRKAEEEGIPILISGMSTFELVGKLCALGLTGS